MGKEVELKLEVLPSALSEVARLPWLSRLSDGAATTEKLVTVYFDTAKSRLREHGLTLCVRNAGNDRLQIIKALDNGARGAMGRDEWEESIASDEPDLKLAEGTPLELLITKKLRRKLKPIFETIVERTAIPVHSGEAELELALDRGHIEADGSREPINEIEIELKRGERTEIGKIAERLAEAVPVGGAGEGGARLRIECRRGGATGPWQPHRALSRYGNRRGIRHYSPLVPEPCYIQSAGCPKG